MYEESTSEKNIKLSNMYVIPLLYMYESFFLRHVRVARAYPHNEEIKYMKKQKKYLFQTQQGN